MIFRDQGIIISKKSFTEKAYIITLFTEKHGLYSGVIREQGKKASNALMEGNLVDFFWSARLHEHLGSAKCELIKSYGSFIIQDKAKLYSFNSIASLIKKAFCEREPHNNFFPKLVDYLEQLKSATDFSFENYIRLEIALLAESGYALRLDSCAATGRENELCYVSPKSGHAVSKEPGKPYEDKLLILPQFLLNNNNKPSREEQRQAFALTSYFLNRYILHGIILKERQALMDCLLCLGKP